MAVVHQQLSILLPRLVSLKDASPFILILETLLQSSYYFITEVLHRLPVETNKILLRFENFDAEPFDQVLDCNGISTEEVSENLKKIFSESKRNVLFIDSLNHIPYDEISRFLMSLILPNCTLFGVFNTSFSYYQHDSSANSYNPSPLSLHSFFSTSKVTLTPGESISEKAEEERDNEITQFLMPLNCNKPFFQVELEHSRRSGRSLTAHYKIDAHKHTIDYFVPKDRTEPTVEEEDPSMLQGLATFNLTTTEEQKKAKEQVPLPFLQAQEVGNGGGAGGAIIYEFEQDDDYDEEDPYEDPF